MKIKITSGNIYKITELWDSEVETLELLVEYLEGKTYEAKEDFGLCTIPMGKSTFELPIRYTESEIEAYLEDFWFKQFCTIKKMERQLKAISASATEQRLRVIENWRIRQKPGRLVRK